MPKMNILLCGGGTGGHYYPLMAIKKDLHSKSDFHFSFIGAKKGIENSKIHNESIPFKLITISGLNRKVSFKSLFQNIVVGINIIIGFFSVLIFFIKQKPNLVISTGGYASFLPLQVARMLKIPYLLHEQNSYPGVITKIFSKDAKAVFLGFKNAEKYLNKTNTIFSGNPVLLNESKSITINMNNDLKTLLVFGGSQGSKFLNDKIKIALQNDKIDFMNVIWIVGKKNYESLKHLNNKSLIIYDYCNEMSSLYQIVDLVLSRSGAMTIAELIKFEKPSILVPFKFSSENHQHFNAKFLEDNFCSKLIKEDDFNDETFVSTLKNLSRDDRILGSMKSNFKNINVPDTLSIISNFIMEKKHAL